MSIDSWPDLFKLLKKYIIPVAVVLFRGLKERVMVFVQLLMKCYCRVNLKGLKLQTLNSNPTCPLKSLTKYTHCLNTFFNTCIPDSYNNNDYQVQFYRTISCQTGEFKAKAIYALHASNTLLMESFQELEILHHRLQCEEPSKKDE